MVSELFVGPKVPRRNVYLPSLLQRGEVLQALGNVPWWASSSPLGVMVQLGPSEGAVRSALA